MLLQLQHHCHTPVAGSFVSTDCNFHRLGHGQNFKQQHASGFVSSRCESEGCCSDDVRQMQVGAAPQGLQDRELTSASLFARVSARAVRASCDAKPLLLSSEPPLLVSGVIGIAGTRSRNRGCAFFADLTFFCTSKISNNESVLDNGPKLDLYTLHEQFI